MLLRTHLSNVPPKNEKAGESSDLPITYSNYKSPAKQQCPGMHTQLSVTQA